MLVGTMGPAIFMVLASYVGCRRILAVVMFTIALFLMGFYYPGMKINALDLSPNFAGSIMALMNGIGVFAGMAVPVVVGVLAPNVSTTILRYQRFKWKSSSKRCQNGGWCFGSALLCLPSQTLSTSVECPERYSRGTSRTCHLKRPRNKILNKIYFKQIHVFFL